MKKIIFFLFLALGLFTFESCVMNSNSMGGRGGSSSYSCNNCNRSGCNGCKARPRGGASYVDWGRRTNNGGCNNGGNNGPRSPRNLGPSDNLFPEEIENQEETENEEYIILEDIPLMH